jgi:hypothetical protein
MHELQPFRLWHFQSMLTHTDEVGLTLLVSQPGGAAAPPYQPMCQYQQELP